MHCDRILGTGGVLARLWPAVEIEQVAADRRRGPRPERPRPRTLAVNRASSPDWGRWADSIRPQIDKAPPELAVQLRNLMNDLMLASGKSR